MECETTNNNLLKIDLQNSYCGPINLREVTISELRHAIDSGLITIEKLTKCYIKRIELMDPIIHSVIEINPDAILIAQELDKELQAGNHRGNLHGIPILLKDNIGTCDKTETCAGSLALIGLKPKEDSEIAKRLRNVGALILGKANLSEFANYRGRELPDGWSGRGKQCSNAYIIGESPSGSSSGSAVAVAANLVTVSLGSETNGSIISPCNVGCVVGLKPTVGLVPNKGVIPLSTSQDSVGPIARNVTDAAIVFDAISNKKLNLECFNINKPSIQPALDKNFRVGVPRLPLWEEFTPEEQRPTLEKVLNALKLTGAITLVDPLPNSELLGASFSWDKEHLIFQHEFKSALNEYLKSEVQAINSEKSHNRCSGIHCLSDIIDFNEADTSIKVYNQSLLKESDKTSGINAEDYKKVVTEMIQAAREEIDTVLESNQLDALVIPSDSWHGFTAVAGYPIITVPAGFNNKGLPFGISFCGTADSEDKLLQIAFILESVYKGRAPSLFKPKELFGDSRQASKEEN